MHIYISIKKSEILWSFSTIVLSSICSKGVHLLVHSTVPAQIPRISIIMDANMNIVPKSINSSKLILLEVKHYTHTSSPECS